MDLEKAGKRGAEIGKRLRKQLINKLAKETEEKKWTEPQN